MSDYKYKISVIVPVYNCGKYLKKCMESLKQQTMAFEDFQVVLVNDGSSDNSGEICKELAQGYSNVVYFEKENGGVSSARNKGLDLAGGKYIMFLDADDTLAEKSLESIYKFFEAHYDDVDLVAYSIDYLSETGKVTTHKRFDVIGETGVYDIESDINIIQTTMNICVKNAGKSERVYFDESLSLGEDQWFIFSWLMRKRKLGFVKEAKYVYFRHSQSASSVLNDPYYCFDQYVRFLNKLLDAYRDENGKAHSMAQALVVYNLGWRITSDRLINRYDSEVQAQQLAVISGILSQVDESVIANSIYIDPYHVDYFMRLKGEKYDIAVNRSTVSAYKDGTLLYSLPHVIMISNFRVKDGRVFVNGYFKHPLSDNSRVKLYCVRSDGEKIFIELKNSVFSYYKSKTMVNCFAGFDTEIEVGDKDSIVFAAEIDGVKAVPGVFFGFRSTVNKSKNTVACNGYVISFIAKTGTFTVKKAKPDKLLAARNKADKAVYSENRNAYVYRKLAYKFFNGKRIWLYTDREGIFDNAYYQFCHDVELNDGIERYYIVDGEDAKSSRFTAKQRKHLVRFKSLKHKLLFLNCEKLLTSFSSLSIMSPFDGLPLRWYSDIAGCEIIYLQHGILHAKLPLLYSKEKANVDKVVVSSDFEIRNFTQNYNFNAKDLLASGMPRFDDINPDSKPEKKILFSPSWRMNLIGPYENNTRELYFDKFTNSVFFKELNEFLNSSELAQLLEKYDYTLDFKNHPIFKGYDCCFKVNNPRIRITQEIDDMQAYAAMITDYSSIVFDFVYLERPVLYFVPDYDLFKAGITHDYNQLDLPLEEGFGPLCANAQQLLSHIEKLISNGMEPSPEYAGRTKNFFLHKGEHCRRLYEQLIKD